MSSGIAAECWSKEQCVCNHLDGKLNVQVEVIANKAGLAAATAASVVTGGVAWETEAAIRRIGWWFGDPWIATSRYCRGVVYGSDMNIETKFTQTVEEYRYAVRQNLTFILEYVLFMKLVFYAAQINNIIIGAFLYYLFDVDSIIELFLFLILANFGYFIGGWCIGSSRYVSKLAKCYEDTLKELGVYSLEKSYIFCEESIKYSDQVTSLVESYSSIRVAWITPDYLVLSRRSGRVSFVRKEAFPGETFNDVVELLEANDVTIKTCNPKGWGFVREFLYPILYPKHVNGSSII